jgi:hypothetical protein
MKVQHPHITMLDFHIHAYLVSKKYDVPKLCEYAIEQYVNLAAMILTLLGPDPATFLPYTAAPAVEPQSCSLINNFLDSLVLLWRNTSGFDVMRRAVLQLMRPDLHRLLQLPFFNTLMAELPEFGEDVARDLEEDGFEVKLRWAAVGANERGMVKFGRA